MKYYKKYHTSIVDNLIMAPTDGRQSSFPYYKNCREIKPSLAQVERYYPDEWLTASTIQKYIHGRRAQKPVIVLTEDWAGNGNPNRGNSVTARKGGEKEDEDEGYSNSPGFNAVILDALADIEKQQIETLVLIPYSSKFHATGIAIHVKKDQPGTIIFIDPHGLPSKTPAIKELLDQFEKSNRYKVGYVSQRQQPSLTRSCDFVFVTAMFKLIEEYIQCGDVTTQGFVTPITRINTVYLFRMYVNNQELVTHFHPMIDEVMLAGFDLWMNFIKEQNLQNTEIITKDLKPAIQLQDHTLETVFAATNEVDGLSRLKLDFIRVFQQKLIELIVLKPDNLIKSVALLIEINKILLNTNSREEFERFYAISKDELILQNLLSPALIERTKRAVMIGMPIIDDRQMDAIKFNRIIESYRSGSFWTRHCISNGKSTTINRLAQLCDKPFVSRTEVQDIISRDSRHRKDLFAEPSELCADKSGTDQVILKLGKAF